MNIDTLLDDMREAAPDPRLCAIDTAVLAGTAFRRERGAARRNLAMTAVVALGIGLGTSLASPQGAQAEPLSLNAVPASAPSNLLLGVR